MGHVFYYRVESFDKEKIYNNHHVILLLLRHFRNLTRIVNCILAAGTDDGNVVLRGGKDNAGCLQTL